MIVETVVSCDLNYIITYSKCDTCRVTMLFRYNITTTLCVGNLETIMYYEKKSCVTTNQTPLK